MIPMTYEMQEAKKSPTPRTAIFVAIDHEDGELNLWNGIGANTWGGKTFTGAGALMSVSGIKSDAQPTVQDITIGLSGVDPSMINLTRLKVRGTQAMVWFALLDLSNRVIPDPVLLRQITLDVVSWQMTDEGDANISVVGQSYLWAFGQATRVAWTPEEQKRKYPEDSGLDMVHTIEGQKSAWTQT